MPARCARIAACLVLSLAVLAAGGSSAQAKKRKHLWATVNVCDTQAHPNELGIRARMPGNGLKQRMYMRFVAQYQDGGGVWHRVTDGGTSPWEYAGSAVFRYEELGYTFTFDGLAPGEGYNMRGLVKFQWREKGKVVRRSHRLTSDGHATSRGDPKGYSAATCFVSG
ncbi:MAG TPA: hypothetical protein VF545_09660 [Thermoleophilaceae bacterium]